MRRNIFCRKTSLKKNIQQILSIMFHILNKRFILYRQLLYTLQSILILISCQITQPKFLLKFLIYIYIHIYIWQFNHNFSIVLRCSSPCSYIKKVMTIIMMKCFSRLTCLHIPFCWSSLLFWSSIWYWFCIK